MKQVDDRDELKAYIVSAFDGTTPENYEKYRILNDIEEKAENSSSRKTSMQNTFRIRKLCISCIVIFLVVLVSGGTYTAVSKIQSYFNEQNKDIRYKDILLDVLYGKSQSDSDSRHKDERYAKALSEDEEPVNIRSLGDYQIAFIGPVTKAGLSDFVFDKSERRTFITVAVSKKDEKSWSSSGDVGFRINVDGEDINDYVLYPLYNVNEFVEKNIRYTVLDITEYNVFGGCEISLNVTDDESGESIIYPLEFKSTYYSKDIKDEYLEQIKAFKEIKKMAMGKHVNLNKSYDDRRTRNAEKETRDFLSKYKKEAINIKSGVKFVINDNAGLFSEWYNLENNPYLISKSRKAYIPFPKDAVKIEGDDIESITLNVTGARIYHKGEVSDEDAKRLQGDYAGIFINTQSYPERKDKPYDVFYDVGHNITWDYNHFSDDIESYGLYISESAQDFLDAEDFIDAEAMSDYWTQIYLSDKVKVDIMVNKKDSSVVKTIAFDFLWKSKETDNGEITTEYEYLYGWE